MAKDCKGKDINIGDKVTITGTVVDTCASDCGPCQVKLDGGAQPIVSIGSELLSASGAPADPPKPIPQVQPAAPSTNQPSPPPNTPAQPTK